MRWIRITRMCEALHSLPVEGGLFDQPGGYILRMESVLRAEQEQAEVEERAEAAKIKVAEQARDMT